MINIHLVKKEIEIFVKKEKTSDYSGEICFGIFEKRIYENLFSKKVTNFFRESVFREISEKIQTSTAPSVYY